MQPVNVRNLEQIQVGDRVSVGYFEGIAADVKRPGEGVRDVEEEIKDARAAPGQRPARAVGRTVTSTVKIEAVDKARNAVTFRRPDGMVGTIAVQRPESREFIRQLNAGERALDIARDRRLCRPDRLRVTGIQPGGHRP